MLPNTVVIGAMKSGTSSLHYYLSLHPQAFMSEEKELDYFVEQMNWTRGRGWYEANFPADSPVRGESSPNYTKYPRFAGVPERMHALIPDARLIYIVRDPIERIVSHYVDAYSFGREHGSISEVLADLDDNHYLNCSRYYLQLSRYFDYYPKERILLVSSEGLKQNRERTLTRVFGFLGIDEAFRTPEFERMVYASNDLTRSTRIGYSMGAAASRISSGRLRPLLPRGIGWPIRAFNKWTGKRIERPALNDRLRSRLSLALEEDVAALRRWSGCTFESWSL